MSTQNELKYKKYNKESGYDFHIIDYKSRDGFAVDTFVNYLNIVYNDGCFLKFLQALMEQYGDFSYEGCYGYYPNNNSPYAEEHFEEGLICFAICFDDDKHRAFLTERQFFRYAKEACLRFVELHPEHRDFVMNIVDNWKPKYPDKFPD